MAGGVFLPAYFYFSLLYQEISFFIKNFHKKVEKKGLHRREKCAEYSLGARKSARNGSENAESA